MPKKQNKNLLLNLKVRIEGFEEIPINKFRLPIKNEIYSRKAKKLLKKEISKLKNLDEFISLCEAKIIKNLRFDVFKK